MISLRMRTPDLPTLGRDSEVAVVGGSLTGPVLGLLLHDAGFRRVTVYESLDDPQSMAGGTIGLDLPSMEVLDSIGLARDCVVPNTSERVVSIKIRDRRETSRSVTLYSGNSTSWGVLHQALERQMPDGMLRLGTRVKSIEHGDGRARLRLSDGVAEADLVLFADGRRSLGRRLLDPDRSLSYAGYVAHRGIVEECSPEEIRDFVRLDGERAQFNVFPIPLASGRVGLDWTFYLPATADQYREMFGASPTARTFVNGSLISPVARWFVDDAAERILPDREAALVARTRARFALPIVDIETPRGAWGRVGGVPAVLIGDALAPVRPHTARGANNGIEQAHGVALALKYHLTYGMDLYAALRAWEGRTIPVVDAAIERGPQLAAEFLGGGSL